MDFRSYLLHHGSLPLTASGIGILQVNLGYRCNMTCKHCHVEAGPSRAEVMSRTTIDAVIGLIRRYPVGILDITGGAPELNPHFRYLVAQARSTGLHVVSRCNLTILLEPEMKGLADFCRDHTVEIIASLPSYTAGPVDRVRGAGVFGRSIEALRLLNGLGYGMTGSGLPLHLVHNPHGAFLPAPQSSLEREYRAALASDHGVSFTDLYVFANMPIGRFKEYLVRSGNYLSYMETLQRSFNAENLPGLMCRRLLSVGWSGTLHDCDFNNVAGIGLSEGNPVNVAYCDLDVLARRSIAVSDHCFGCTAGQGST